MDGIFEHPLICRACLRIVENKTQSFGYIEDANGNLKDMIMCCVPEMDIYVSSNPIMCFPCIQLLVTVYNFKTRCLNTETIIRSYVHRNNLAEYNHVNLSCVVQELIRLNTYYRDMHQRKIEAAKQNMECNPQRLNGNPDVPCGVHQRPSGTHFMPQDGMERNPQALNGVPEVPYGAHQRAVGMHFMSQDGIERNPQTVNNTLEVPYGVQQGVPGNHFMSQDTMERNPQTINGVPEAPYGIHQRAPGNHFMSHNGVTNTENRVVHENALGSHAIGVPKVQSMADTSPEIIRHHAMMENHYMLRQQAMVEHQRMLQSLPANPALGNQRGTPLVPQVLMEDGESNQDTDEDQHTLDKEIVQNRNVQENSSYNETVRQDGHYDTAENHFDKSENEIEAESNNSEEVNEKTEGMTPAQPEKNDGMTPAQSEAGTDETNNTARFQDSGGNSLTEDDAQKVPVEENRPRLIIKICKNRVTVPSDRNEDSNEKENKEIAQMNRSEMPPPESNPFEMYPSYDNRQELYQCSNCTFITTHISYYIAHKNVCGNDLIEKKCPHCPHVTNRQYALNKHINTVHTKSIWYSCDMCPYRSTDTSCLRRHKRNVHPDKLENDLMCHLCTYRCSTEYHLKKHMLKHDDHASALQCQFCSYSTKDRSNFRKHVFIHNPKPQNCEFCDYKCVSPYQMKLHLKKFHHGVGMEDVDCRSEVSLSEVVEDIGAAIKEAKQLVGHQTE